jgi:DNA-3-methyladenine glycosylase
MDREEMRLTREFFERHPLVVAFDLLSWEVTVNRDGAVVSGRIVEVEAYAGPDDPASHAGKYRAGTRALFSLPGTLYMYRSYGIHTMWNIVAHEHGHYGAVLVRAVEPTGGQDIMRERRGAKAMKLASGPGSLCQALDLRLADDGADLLSIDWLELRPSDRCAVVLAGPRIGISRGLSARWRLFDPGSREISAHRQGEVVTHDMITSLIPAPGTAIS